MIATPRHMSQFASADCHDESTTRVAFQGELGAYSDEAIRRHWHGSAISAPSASFEHVIADVAWEICDFGVLPVWNSIVGDIAAGCAAVRTARNPPYGLVVGGDTHVVVRHQLLALPGTRLRDIEAATSHPAALAQCAAFFKTHPTIVPTPAYDTAGAARDVATQRLKNTAAIAGHLASERYGLVALEKDIQDVPDNVTHFLIIARSSRAAMSATMLRTVEVNRW